jgi:heterodisulfide reductase subunit A-like polyferredoxin
MPLYETKGRYIIDFPDIPTKRARMPEIPVSERKNNFDEVETGLPEDLAVSEAKRCLGCRRCLGCALCWAECRPEAITFDQPGRVDILKVDRVILTPGVEQPIKPIPGHPERRWDNVITDLQAERMLAVTGPTDGWIIRPYDGEIPKRIAFVQTIVPESKQTSKSMVTLGANEAIIWKRRMARAEIALISPVLHVLGRETSQLLPVMELVEGTVTKIAESEGNHNVELHYALDDVEKARTFDLAVILTEPVVSPFIQAVSEKLGKDPSEGLPL